MTKYKDVYIALVKVGNPSPTPGSALWWAVNSENVGKTVLILNTETGEIVDEHRVEVNSLRVVRDSREPVAQCPSRHPFSGITCKYPEGHLGEHATPLLPDRWVASDRYYRSWPNREGQDE